MDKYKNRTAPIVETVTDDDGNTLVKLSLVQARAAGQFSFQELTVEEAADLAGQLTEAVG